MSDKRRWWKWPAVIAVASVMVAAATLSLSTSSHAEGDAEGWFHYVDYYVGQEDEIDDVRTRLLSELDGAQVRIDTAIAELDDDEIQQALINAADRGVRVRVVADELYADADGFAPLVAHDDISVVFGDGELSYLPEPNLAPLLRFCDQEFTEHDDHRTCTNVREADENNDGEMVRPAHYNTMSHTFFLIDETTTWNITAPLTDDQQVWFAFRAMSEELTNSYEREFRQMHGGVFSTTLSVYNGPLKSITHQSPLRLTNQGQLRVRFNPQERLVKNIVDETYRAKASVFVMTENLTNTDLIKALAYKKNNGFDVRVMVGQGQAESEAIAVPMRALDAVEAPEEMGRLPTVVIFDSERDRNGTQRARTVQVLSHDLLRAQPFEVLTSPTDSHDRVRFYPSDTFADGVLWEIVESGVGSGARNPAADEFVDTWNEMWAEANDG